MKINVISAALITMLVGLIYCVPTLAKVDAETCVAAWIFDQEDAKVIRDITDGGNDGEVQGKPEWEAGPFGKALVLNGQQDSVAFPGNDQVNVGQENFSLVAWVKTPNYIPNGWRDNFVDKHETNPRRGYVLGLRGVEDAANQGTAWFILGLNEPSGFQIHSTTLINDEKWHHIAVTVDRRGKIRMYANGIMEVDQDISHLSKENEDTVKELVIGGSGGDLVEGSVDEIALFSVALEEDDVLTIMDRGLEATLGLRAVSAQEKLTVTWATIKG